MSVELVSLGECCKFVSGSTVPLGEEYRKQPDGYLILKVSDLNLPENQYTVSDSNESIANAPKGSMVCSENSIVLPKRGGAISTNKKRLLLRPAILDPNLMGITPQLSKLDPKYLYYWFQQFDLTSITSGSAVPQLNKQDLDPLRIPLPPLTEQKRIASLLARADRLRQLRRTAHDLSDSVLQSVFLEMFGDSRTNPKGWKVEKVGKHIKNIRYGTGSPPDYYEKGIPFIRATNVKEGTIKEKGLVYISEEDAKKISKCRISAGDLIVVRSGINSGDCALIPPEYDGAYAAYDLIVEVPYPMNYFFNTIINSPFGKETIATLSRRAGQPHVNSEQIESMEFPIPPLNLQEEFAGVVARVEGLRGRMGESTRQVEGLFESLLAEAFS